MLQRLAISRLGIPQDIAILLAAAGLTIAASAMAWLRGPADQGHFDSAFYLDGARHLARGEGYVSAYVEPGRTDYEPITHWAPGTSALIAIVTWFGASPLTAAASVLGGCYVGAVLLVFVLGVELAGSRFWPASLLVSLLFALQPSTLVWLDAILSDLPCATFALLNMWLGLRVMRAFSASLWLRVAWGLCIAWLDLVRYAGLLFVPGLLVATVLGMQVRRPLWARAWLLWPTVVTAGLGIAAWNIRNQRVADAPLGGWTFVDSEISQHAMRAGRGAFIWVDELMQEASFLGADVPVRVLLSLAAVCVIPLALVSVRAAWREASLVGLTAGGYYGLMVLTASVTLIASLSDTRFWVAVWPMEFLLVLIAVARATPRWCSGPKVVVLAALLCAIGLYASKAYRDAPNAKRPGGLLDPAWASATEVLPEPDQCRLYVNDPRPYMLNRQLAPTSSIPLTLAEFEAAVKQSPAVCLVISAPQRRLRLSSSAERRRKLQMEVVNALLAQKRLERIARRAGVTVYRLH
jgi:hypothetical protein